MCKGICERDDREFDHVIPLRNLLKGQEQIFQMLCVGCHAEKTKLEPMFDKDPLASVFSKATYEAYVEHAAPHLSSACPTGPRWEPPCG